MQASSLFLRAKKWLRLAGSHISKPRISNQRGNGRAANVNWKLEVQVRAFRRALFLRQEILPSFVSLHLVGTGDMLLGRGRGRDPTMDYHSIQGRVRKHSQLQRKLGWVRPDGLGSDAEFSFYLLLIILCKIAVGRGVSHITKRKLNKK